jgi:hypothetical protein
VGNTELGPITWTRLDTLSRWRHGFEPRWDCAVALPPFGGRFSSVSWQISETDVWADVPSVPALLTKTLAGLQQYWKMLDVLRSSGRFFGPDDIVEIRNRKSLATRLDHVRVTSKIVKSVCSTRDK